MRAKLIILATVLGTAAATPAAAQKLPGEKGPERQGKLRAEKRPVLKARWDAAGWTMLGQRVVQGAGDHDTIRVGKREGKFTSLMVVVEGSELEIHDMKITFGNGESMDPKIRHFFKENSLTRQVDLPGNERFIKTIDFKYSNLPGGGRAKVQVWAKEGAAGPGPGPGGPGPVVGGGGGILKPRWDSGGWVKLGERVVQGKNDRDVIPVGLPAGGFSKLMVTVEGSELEMHDMVVEFGNGEKWSPTLRHFFRERSATRAIELPGARTERKIKRIAFQYGNLPGGGKSKVAVWALDPDRFRAYRMTDAEKWWKLRQKELAKAAADRDKWLLAQEELLARERAARRDARRAEILARWEQTFLSQEKVWSELTVHAQRAARLNRMLRLAEAAGNGKLAVRVRVLLDIENARHDMNMMALRGP